MIRKPVKPERSYWRDHSLSERHRRWGWDCPAVDLDFLLLEYDRGEPVALIEYKHQDAPPQYTSHPTLRAVISLGNRAAIPVFGVRYAKDFTWWAVVPLNAPAKKHLPERVTMSEIEWVTFLHEIRGYRLPADVLAWLDVAV